MRTRILFCFFVCQGGNVHVYRATPKQSAVGGKGRKPAACRYFARVASETVGRGKRYIMEQVYVMREREFWHLTTLFVFPFCGCVFLKGSPSATLAAENDYMRE